MSHDFSIETAVSRFTPNEPNENQRAYFFGLAGGLMYDAFNHPECNYGVSGNGRSFYISRQEAIDGLTKAVENFKKINYPDPKRADDIADFLAKIEAGEIKSKRFKICFS